MPKTPQLYGLLIAIDDYPSPVPPLGGCVNDIRKIKTYLQKEQATLDPQLLVLENEAATKTAIIDGFRKHLAQAKDGDTALVYFSGHGTQEDADPKVWPFETDAKLECMVNYDGIMKTEEGMKFNLLADKELRFLLHELDKTKAHIITIFDCCHSGGNTREASLGGETAKASRRYVTSRLTQACPQRNWEQFIFADSIDQADLSRLPLSEVIPVGQHVQMGACRSDQLAYEVDGGGVFTSTLLQLLESTRSEINYSDLRSRIRYMVKNEYKQTPQVYVQGNDALQLFSGFLGREVKRQQNEGNVVYNKTEGWVLDLGALHGVAADLDTIQVMDQDGKVLADAKVQAVKMSHTRLVVDEGLEQSKGYRALVPGAMAQPIRIYIADAEKEKEGAQFLREEMKKIVGKFLLVEAENEADYVIRMPGETYTITHPFDEKRPVVRQFDKRTDRTAEALWIILGRIAKWAFVKNLYNPNIRIFQKSPVDVELFLVKPDQSQVPLELNGEELVLPYRKMPNGAWENAIRMKITNRHTSRLYCSLIYLSEAFQIYSSLLGEPVVFLEPGESAWAFEGGDVEFDFPEHIKVFNWPNSFTWVKLIVSTDEFDPAVFDEDPIVMATDPPTRGIKLASPSKFKASDWTTQLLQIRMPNPEYKEE